MTTSAPTPQEKVLKRVLTISRFNGWSVVVIAALGILLTLVLGDLLGSIIGLLAVVSGWMEIRGSHKLKQRNANGMKWLVRSQMLLLAVILAYCASRLGSFDDETVMSNLTPDMEILLNEAGLKRDDILPLVRLAFFCTYSAVALTCLVYQGGLALYYRSKTRLVTEALSTPPMPPNQ